MHYCLNKPGSEVGSLNFQSPISANPTKKLSLTALLFTCFMVKGEIFFDIFSLCPCWQFSLTDTLNRSLVLDFSGNNGNNLLH